MIAKRKNTVFANMLKRFCDKKAAIVLSDKNVSQLRTYMIELLHTGNYPPMRRGKINWDEVSAASGINNISAETKDVLRPGFDALIRELNQKSRFHRTENRKPVSNAAQIKAQSDTAYTKAKRIKNRPGPQSQAIVKFPKASPEPWVDPESFSKALDLHMTRHGDTSYSLHKAIVKPGESFDIKTLTTWRRGRKSPRTLNSFKILTRIETRYRLPSGYFKKKLPHPGRSAIGYRLKNVTQAEQRRLAWHLPDDFNQRSTKEQNEIIEWVRRVIISGTTDFRLYHKKAIKDRFSIRFPQITQSRQNKKSNTLDAPPLLSAEMADLIKFKTATLTAIGYQRSGVWGQETASQKIEHLGLMFGALTASPNSKIGGLGIPLENLTFGLFVFPQIWDWYLEWRECRRGFYTAWEVDMIRTSLAMTRENTGWVRQRPDLSRHLSPVPGFISADEISAVQADWDAACETYHQHGKARVKEIKRVARTHRDPFEPIMPILESASPVGEYKKIADEILRFMPDKSLYPKDAAESVRAFLMIRLGLHLGLRQKNLRQLMVCYKGEFPTSERQLTETKRGEIRWDERSSGWEVFIPATAFKNANSSYFAGKPFRLVLPDLGDLYHYIDEYLNKHRNVLLRNARDPGAFFVKTVKATTTDASYSQNSFYEAWRLIVQRYGIYNPYTSRGVIEGLLPHGPHNVRDVLATHILKHTGSYEQASYAIQDTPEMVEKHYGRFLPQDKAALAAKILNKVWDD